MPTRRRTAAIVLAVPLAVAATVGWTWPVDGGGNDAAPVVIEPFDAPDHSYGPGHRGLDLAARAGDVVRAPADGVVVLAQDVAGVPVVVVAHGSFRGPQELRSTLQPAIAEVPVGSLVKEGRAIASLGSWSGHCDGSCLHWGVRRGTDYLDPGSLLSGPIRLLPLGPPVPRGSSGDGSSDGAVAASAINHDPPSVKSAEEQTASGGTSEAATGRRGTGQAANDDGPPRGPQVVLGAAVAAAALAVGSGRIRRP